MKEYNVVIETVYEVNLEAESKEDVREQIKFICNNGMLEDYFIGEDIYIREMTTEVGVYPFNFGEEE